MMEIRLATEDDLYRIDEIYNQAIEMKMATADTVPYTQTERKEWFRSHNPDSFPVYVAVEDEAIIGYLTFSPYRPRRVALRYAVEISYFVDKNFRRKGVGSKLMEYGIKILKEYGYKYVIAILLGHNINSIGLLKKYGFGEWGLMPGIAEFDGDRYDHLYYGLDLTKEQ